MFTTIHRLPATLAAALFLCAGHPADAAPEVRAACSSNITPAVPAQVASSGSVSNQLERTAPTGTTTGRCTATFGVLRAYANATAGNRDSFVYSNFGFSTASWRDDFLIDAPGLTGTSGTVTVRFTVEGFITASRNGVSTVFSADPSYASAHYRFGVEPGSSPTKQERVYADGRRDGVAFLGIPQEFTIPFTFGTPLVNVMLEIQAGAVPYGERFYYSTAATSDLEHTANWGGIASVRDAAGNLVANYTFSSASGFDYTQAVPVPATFARWASANGLSGPAADPTADPNGSGLPNLMKYALGLPASATGGQGLAHGIATDGQGNRYAALAYTKPAGANAPTDILYLPERIEALNGATWSSAADDVVEVGTVPGPGNLQTVTVRSTHPIGSANPHDFLRLRVSVLP